ncbi:beta strand repeat-containing protein [Polynucleobacter yangtzensis]|uniref:beta strand repeat-containing protein n=1 Tax=Polynucleobacter yangtzensis TaxID=1743159 RepID=UPI00082FAD2D|nr:autotransporter outer membrane beta-barrel domain-containing protein [Polynucleobacter yangtzensis]
MNSRLTSAILVTYFMGFASAPAFAANCPSTVIDSSITTGCDLPTGLVTVTSTGNITAPSNTAGIHGNISSAAGIDNYGSVTSGSGYPSIWIQSGTVDSITNNSNAVLTGSSYGIQNAGTVTSITNSGNITGTTYGGIYNQSGTIGTLTNNSGALITGTTYGGVYNWNGGTITNIINSGTISTTGSSGNSHGIWNYASTSTISTLTNNSGGLITGTDYGINNSGTITTLNNIGGVISGGTAGIFNARVIGTLNNYQGGNGATASTTALTYTNSTGTLTNYNIGINSTTNYGQLWATNATAIANFGIYGSPTLTSRTYSGVLNGNVTVSTTSSGTYDNMRWSLSLNGVSGKYDLVFTGASLIWTQQSLANTANALQPIFALQNTVLTNSFTYDCPVFDKNNICISAGGRNTAVSAANGLNNTSALLIAAYRPHPHYRIGAYADQNLSVNNAGATVNLGNNTPLLGLFGVWNERLDDTGTQVKVSAAYGQKNTTVTRQVVGLSEAGSGSSQLNSQGAQLSAKYGFAIAQNVILSPYAGVRYTQNNMGGYAESASSSVTAPLTYSALNTNATTVLAGLGAQYKGIPKTNLFASAGVESDTNTQNGSINATGISGLTSVNFNPNPVKTRPTAMLGASYDIEKNQRLGITGIYRQEAYQAVGTTTVMATYTVGL